MGLDVNTVIQGDCLEVMRSLPDNSVDSFVSDPPAGIAFMDKKWDTDKGGRKQWCAYMEERFAEALRICKPGSYGLVWALPRTSHWTATALEDAGWELKEIITHIFGSGFPKSMNVGKAIDKMKGCDREVIGVAADFARDGSRRKADDSHAISAHKFIEGSSWSKPVTAPASPEAKQWEGFGTALKPASEHWILVRKPIEGTIAGNVLKWGVGGINIDGCRVATADSLERVQGNGGKSVAREGPNNGYVSLPQTQGRFPPNLLLSHSHDCNDSGCADDCPVKVLDEQTGILKSGAISPHHARSTSKTKNSYGERAAPPENYPSSEGGASRYFPNFHYYPKASTKDRTCGGKAENNHPTVKNRELMRWLCRLVTPPGGTILDCFAGSGSTAIACLEEGFNYILIEQDNESVKTAKDRVKAWLKDNRPEPTLEQRITWLETKVTAIDKRTRKKARVGQLNLFDEVG